MALSATEIKIKILRNGDTLAGLARKWQEENPGLVITEQVLSRVIHRRAPYVYPEVRQLLARYLGKSVSQVGREPQPRKVEETAEAA
jgi:hypothetical protein